MTKTEQELIELIRSHHSPGLALETAIGVILDFLTQPSSSETQDSSVLQEVV
jgi:hypothetical protein